MDPAVYLITLGRDILTKIYGLLPPIYKIILRRTCKSLRAELAEVDIVAIINSRIGFSIQAHEKGSVITGEFLLDCIYDTNYASNVVILIDDNSAIIRLGRVITKPKRADIIEYLSITEGFLNVYNQ